MFRLEKIMKDNNITKNKICTLIKLQRQQLHYIFKGKLDFNLQDLKLIRDYLINVNAVKPSQDLGELLSEI